MRARFLTLWTVAVIATAASFIVHLTLRFETVRLGYKVGDARAEQRHLQDQKRLLSIEAATLRQADRVEAVARSTFQMEVVSPARVISAGKSAQAPRLSGRTQ